MPYSFNKEAANTNIIGLESGRGSLAPRGRGNTRGRGGARGGGMKLIPVVFAIHNDKLTIHYLLVQRHRGGYAQETQDRRRTFIQGIVGRSDGGALSRHQYDLFLGGGVQALEADQRQHQRQLQQRQQRQAQAQAQMGRGAGETPQQLQPQPPPQPQP